MGQAQINVRTRACSRTFIARTKQAALTHHVRRKEINACHFDRQLSNILCMVNINPFRLTFFSVKTMSADLS